MQPLLRDPLPLLLGGGRARRLIALILPFALVTQIVESVRRAAQGYASRNASFAGGARVLTTRSFLSANAIRATDSMDEIDWCSSNNSTRCAVRNIGVPILVTAMGALVWIAAGGGGAASCGTLAAVTSWLADRRSDTSTTAVSTSAATPASTVGVSARAARLRHRRR